MSDQSNPLQQPQETEGTCLIDDARDEHEEKKEEEILSDFSVLDPYQLLFSHLPSADNLFLKISCSPLRSHMAQGSHALYDFLMACPDLATIREVTGTPDAQAVRDLYDVIRNISHDYSYTSYKALLERGQQAVIAYLCDQGYSYGHPLFYMTYRQEYSSSRDRLPFPLLVYALLVAPLSPHRCGTTSMAQAYLEQAKRLVRPSAGYSFDPCMNWVSHTIFSLQMYSRFTS